MLEQKPSRPPEGNEYKIPTEGNKGQDSNTKKYRGKKQPQNKSSLDPEAETDLQGRCTDLEGYTFDLGSRASDKVSRKMKELDRYLGTICSDSCQPAIMTETAATFPDSKIPIITELGTERPKTDEEMTCLEKNNIDESILQTLMKKDVYKSDMHKIYNMVLGQTNEQLQDKAASDATFQAVKTDRYPIGYLMILKIVSSQISLNSTQSNNLAFLQGSCITL